MSEFGEKIRLKEKAEEDIYFARRDRERIRALHEKGSSVSEDTDFREQGDQCLEEEATGAEPIKARGCTVSTITRWLRKLAGKN